MFESNNKMKTIRQLISMFKQGVYVKIKKLCCKTLLKIYNVLNELCGMDTVDCSTVQR